MAMFCGILVGLITAAILYYYLFDDFSEFLDCIRLWLTPDILDWMRGELDRDFWAGFKLLIWFGVSILMGLGVYFKMV